MCGRYTLTNTEQLSLRFGVAEAPLEPRYNVAPSQQVPVIVAGRDGAELCMAVWGFRPQRLPSDAPAPINARAETVAERPLFRGALARYRCLVPADGFYEWQAKDGRRGRQPYRFCLADDALFAFAGLYTPAESDDRRTVAIITTAPNDLVAPVHNRMPAILTRDQEALWLDPEMRDPGIALACLGPYPADQMRGYPVSTLVSNVRNETPDVIAPLQGEG
jgi:putative SOS response-associated peptidase YedK